MLKSKIFFVIVTCASSKYYKPEALSNQIISLNKKGLFIIHFNTISLQKNLNRIEELLIELRDIPDIITISETKLIANRCLNFNIRNYAFLQHNFPTNTGRVGLYIRKGIK